jgi:hypothetical protein
LHDEMDFTIFEKWTSATSNTPMTRAWLELTDIRMARAGSHILCTRMCVRNPYNTYRDILERSSARDPRYGYLLCVQIRTSVLVGMSLDPPFVGPLWSQCSE